MPEVRRRHVSAHKGNEGHHDIDLSEKAVNQGSIDLVKLRGELRHMSRGHLLMIADRAIDLVPCEILQVLVEGFVSIPRLVVEEPCGRLSRNVHPGIVSSDRIPVMPTSTTPALCGTCAGAYGAATQSPR